MKGPWNWIVGIAGIGAMVGLLTIADAQGRTVNAEQAKKAKQAESDVARIAKSIQDHVENTFEIPGGVEAEAFVTGDQSKAVVKSILKHDSDGEWLDPWGSQYEMLIDTDFDGRFEFNGVKFTEASLVRSIGADKTGGTVDDIYSASGVVGLAELGVAPSGTPWTWFAILGGLLLLVFLIVRTIWKRLRGRRVVGSAAGTG